MKVRRSIVPLAFCLVAAGSLLNACSEGQDPPPQLCRCPMPERRDLHERRWDLHLRVRSRIFWIRVPDRHRRLRPKPVPERWIMRGRGERLQLPLRALLLRAGL